MIRSSSKHTMIRSVLTYIILLEQTIEQLLQLFSRHSLEEPQPRSVQMQPMSVRKYECEQIGFRICLGRGAAETEVVREGEQRKLVHWES